MSDIPRRAGRKLLVASLGVAAVSAVACDRVKSPNRDAAAADVAADRDSGGPIIVIPGDAGTLAPDGAAPDARQIVANIVAPYIDEESSGERGRG
jgi:hypothetical protein